MELFLDLTGADTGRAYLTARAAAVGPVDGQVRVRPPARPRSTGVFGGDPPSTWGDPLGILIQSVCGPTVGHLGYGLPPNAA